MKRALAFALVLGAGALALWWADGSSRARMARAAESRPETEPRASEPAAEPAAGPTPTPRQDVVIIRGQTTITVFPQGLGLQKRTHQIEGVFEPQDRLGHRYLVRDLVTQVYGADGEVIETITAARARFRLEVEGTPENPLGRIEIAEQGRIRLEEVTVTRRTGHPLAPLVFTAPKLDAYLAEDRLVSGADAEVAVVGRGIRGAGRGFRYEGATGFLSLDHGGELRLERAGEDPVRFLAPTGGPLEVERVGAPDEGRLEVRATRGGQLITSSRPATQVDAQHVVLRGQVQNESFLIEEGAAAGEVVATRGTERYQAESARLFMDEAGHLARAVLDREPLARLRLVDEQGQESFVLAQGAGPLTVWLTEGAEQRFLLVGPGSAEFEGRDLVIEADGRLEGSAAADLTSVTILARRGVAVLHGESRLDTDSLDALLLAGPAAAELYCVGATRLTTRDADGAVVTFDAREEADVRVRAGRWTVPLAREVEVHVLGAHPFRATAGVVRELDPYTHSMQLEEGASWVGVFGEADASRAVLRGPRSGTLYGIPGSPARFRVLPQRADPALDTVLELAAFSALTIDVTPEHVQATGEVRLRLEGPARTWEVDAADLRFSLLPQRTPDEPRMFTFAASAVTRAEAVEGDTTTAVRCERLLGGGVLHGPADAAAQLEVTWAVGTGGVEVDRGGPASFFARGERVAFQGGTARLTPRAGARVEFWAPRSEGDPAWRFEAQALTFDGDALRAERPTGRFDGALLPGPAVPGAVVQPGTVEATRLYLAPGSLLLEGHVLAQGSDAEGVPLVLEAGNLRILGETAGAGAPSLRSVESFEAWGGFRGVYGGLALVRGERCEVTPGRVGLFGTDERPALLDMGGTALRSPRLVLDLERFLIESDRGEIVAAKSGGGWTLSYAALRPVEANGETLIVVVAPRYESPGDHARADFAAVWLIADAWAAVGREKLFGEPRTLDEEPLEVPPPAPADPDRPDLVHNVFRTLLGGQVGELVRAAHIEGSLEVTRQGRTVARASEAWFDLEGQHTWLHDATLVVQMDMSGEDRHNRVRVRAGEIISKGDGSLRAADATLTTSTHEVPGYVIRTGELVLLPREDGLWSFSARPNRIRFKNGLSLPLPPLGNLVLDEGGDFVGFETQTGEVRTIENLTIGDAARHGMTIGGAIRYPVGGFGKSLGRFFGFEDTSVRGDWASEVSYLSSRGFLLGTGLELRQREASGSPDEYWFNLYAKGIDDRGEDRGLVRVDREDRRDLRSWIYGRGRYPFSRTEWIGTQFSTQSDPGMQAEFYEREFQRYEQRENDLYWRRGDGSNLYTARVMGRVDSYRTEVEELPAADLYGGETPIAHLGEVPLLWGRSFEAAYLRRREGDLAYEDPFFDTLGQPDGFGDREVLRAATTHRLATPLRTGVADVVATPWLEAELVAWDEGVDEETAPRRAALLGGLDLATTLYKRTDAGYLHVLSPTMHFKGDLALEEEDGQPVRFDELEDSPEGDEVGAGLRALWSHPERPHNLDVALRAVQRRDRGVRSDTDRLALLGAYHTVVLGRPFGLLSDLRVDPADGTTIYGRSTLAIAPTDDWLLEISHRRGRDAEGRGLFETASFDARWTIDSKWELQLGQDVNLLGSGTLRSEAILRRFGADFLFELQVLHRAGEGGTTVRVNFAPMFLWKRRPLGVLERGK